MPSKQSKFQILDKQGNIIESGNLRTKTQTIDGIPIDPELEKPLVSLTVTNPFKKILYWLDQIRKKQTTTLAIKLSIPLIALPVVIAGVFSLGRLSGISFQKSVQTHDVVSQLPTPTPRQTTSVSKAGTLKIAKGNTKTSYLLSLRNGTIMNLEIPPNIDLTRYQNKQILVTGIFNESTGILNVTDIAEIEVFNSLEIPAATKSAQ